MTIDEAILVMEGHVNRTGELLQHLNDNLLKESHETYKIALDALKFVKKYKGSEG